MKNIKRKIFQIILTVFMVFSSCFLTSTVEAVDDTGNAARSSGYFTNENIYVSDNKIEEKESFKDERPEFIASSISTGSDLSEGATEGMVWTNKKIEIIDRNTGIYKITFQALGFKYRYVDDKNNKVNDVWKNPLAAGSTLTISEEIAENFHVIEDDNTYPMKLTDEYEKYFKEDANIDIKPDGGKVTLSFNANDIQLDKTHEDGFKYDEKGGIAFDVEGSFYVQIDNNVEDTEKTYSTGEGESSFKPAEDNFYYYEWGTTEDTLDYGYYGIKWTGSGTAFDTIQGIRNITVYGKNNEPIIFTPCSTGNGLQIETIGNITNISSKDIGPGNYPQKTPEKDYNDYYWVDIIEELYLEHPNLYDWDSLGVDKLYLYLKRVDNTFLMRVEVHYIGDSDNTWTILKPEEDKDSTGGNNHDLIRWDYITIINKEDSVIRKDKDPNGDGIIDEVFDNHGEITLALPSIGDVETKKTASLIDWDERTYRIDLYARSKLEQQAEPVDIMFALDFSGSMPWLISEPSQTIKYDELNTSENISFYSIHHGETPGTIAKWQSFEYFIYDESAKEYKPIGYFNNQNCPTKPDPEEGKFAGAGWYALKSQGAVGSSKENAGNIIYNEKIKIDFNYKGKIYKKTSADKTKLDKLLEQVQSFIDSLADSSPNSRVGFTVYAGRKIANKELVDASNLIGDGLKAFVEDLKLEGNTRQGVGIEESANLLQNSTRNKYIIMFTDGIETENGDGEWAYTAATDARNNGIQIYTIGLASEDVLNAKPENMVGCPDNGENFRSRLQRWSSGEGYYYAASNYTVFEEAFNSIFDDLVGSIKNVTIIDVIDDRFEITAESRNELLESGIRVDGNKVTWRIDELRFYEDVLDGLHLSIEIVAKDDFLGGNYIPTNDPDQSKVIVGDGSKPLNKPVVNVKPKLNLQDDENTYFLGEEINPVDFIDSLLVGSNIELTNEQKTSLGNEEVIEFLYSYDGTNDNLGKISAKYEPITEDGMVSDLDKHSASKVGEHVEQYKLTLTYTPYSPNTRNPSLGSYTDTSFEDRHDSCDHTDDLRLKGVPHIAQKVDTTGIYTVDVVAGSIKINKTINSIADIDIQGDAIVTFLIEGETESGQYIHKYKVMRFTNAETQTFELKDLEKGVYTITELNSIRYDLADDGISIDKNDTNVPIVDDIENKKVTFYIGYTSTGTKTTNLKAKNVEATFTNELVNDENIGDTDVVTNKFSVNEDGSVTIQKDYYTVSQD